MQYRTLGGTGTVVSAQCLGTMTFGQESSEEIAHAQLDRFVEAGGNVVDTADVYSDGTSEEFVGRALADFAVREEVVIATKVHGTMRPGANGGGLSRRHILSAIDDSLRRLGTDYVDLYQIHRWDPQVPIEETMETLHDVVRSGKARYIGASSMWAWQFAKAQYTADLGGWTEVNKKYFDKEDGIVTQIEGSTG